jgi:hypothetical protein
MTEYFSRLPDNCKAWHWLSKDICEIWEILKYLLSKISKEYSA